MYWMNLIESISQVFNAVHGGNPNETFSARVAGKRGQTHWYWSSWVWVFETFWKGHLDWAMTPDDDQTFPQTPE
jgi:hypothetical protein